MAISVVNEYVGVQDWIIGGALASESSFQCMESPQRDDLCWGLAVGLASWLSATVWAFKGWPSEGSHLVAFCE
jgi:hypothetical protein